MSQRPNIERLLFASGNRDKLDEFRSVLGLPNLQFSDVATREVQDANLETLARNKVAEVSKILPHVPFFVDHTGLLIEAWNGWPGGQTSMLIRQVGVLGICRMLDGFENRAARVRTVIGYCVDKSVQVFEGSAFGMIAREPRGGDLGFDSIFIPEGHDRTYGELGPDYVYTISMRRNACAHFARYLERTFVNSTGEAYRWRSPSSARGSLPAGKIFISYRRSDSRYQARSIYDEIAKAIPVDRVFMDIDSIKMGSNFVAALSEAVDSCSMMLVLIGPDWINARNPSTNQRRLDDPDDFVRIEVREALRRGIPVVPVLIDHTVVPTSDELPGDIKELSNRQAHFVQFRTSSTDIRGLIGKLPEVG